MAGSRLHLKPRGPCGTAPAPATTSAGADRVGASPAAHTHFGESHPPTSAPAGHTRTTAAGRRSLNPCCATAQPRGQPSGGPRPPGWVGGWVGVRGRGRGSPASMELGHTRPSKPSSRARKRRSTPKGLPASAPAGRGGRGGRKGGEPRGRRVGSWRFRWGGRGAPVARGRRRGAERHRRRRAWPRRRTRAQRQGAHARHEVADAHVVTLPRRSVAQQPVAPPHRLRGSTGERTQQAKQAGSAPHRCAVLCTRA